MATVVANDVVMLDHFQLKKLALLLRNNEELLMNKVMKSENERAVYLKSVNDVYDKTISLIDDGTAMVDKHVAMDGASGERTSIARDIRSYVEHFLNFSMQSLRNYSLRVSCVDKIRVHYDSLVRDLSSLHPENVANVRKMAKETALFKECMWEYCDKHRSGGARALSKAYSMVLKQEGIKFPDLVKRHKNRLGFEGEFEQLADAQKLEVYNSIIEESGRAKIPKLEIASTVVGIGVLVVTAGLIVWDIFTAEHKIEAVLNNSLFVLKEVGAFAVQVAVQAAVTEAFTEAGLGVFVVSLGGFVAGLAAGFLFSVAAGFLIDLIMGSGGTKAPDLSGLTFHTANMPDGMALANAMTHE